MSGKTAEQCSIHSQEGCEFLTRLGYTINIAKSQLNPSKTVTFLGFVIDSESMTLSLPGSKIEKIVSHCKRLLLNPAPTVREVAQVSGLLVSAFRAVKYMKRFYRSTEMCKCELISCGASFEDPYPLSVQARDDLQWMIHNIADHNGLALIVPSPDITIACDTSGVGWGACCNTRNTGGLWSLTETTHHINYLETLAAFVALKCFTNELRNAHVQLQIDNMTAVYYINNMGVIHSPVINLLSRNVWEWCIARNLMLSAIHVSGIHNETADFNSRHFNDRTEWSLHPTVFKWLSQATFDPDIDLFASRLNAKVPRFESCSPDPSAFACDAFSLIWKDFNAYAFPSFSLIPRVLVHLKRDKVQRALIITPVRPSQSWYPTLLELKWL